jgi:hypothetical protein
MHRRMATSDRVCVCGIAMYRRMATRVCCGIAMHRRMATRDCLCVPSHGDECSPGAWRRVRCVARRRMATCSAAERLAHAHK